VRNQQQQQEQKKSLAASKTGEAPKGRAPITLVIDAKNNCAATFYAAKDLPNRQRLKIFTILAKK